MAFSHSHHVATESNPKGFGIRIESLVRIARAEPLALPAAASGAASASDSAEAAGTPARASLKESKFLTLETLTMAPIDTRLVDAALLSPEDIAWLNDYHRLVRHTLEPELRQRGLRQAFNWLVRRTADISRN